MPKTGTFNPKNKAFYKGRLSKRLMSFSGMTCVILGEITYPANQTQSGNEETVVAIRFPNHVMTFHVRTKDVTATENSAK